MERDSYQPLHSLTRSMPRRVVAVIQAEGWYTKRDRCVIYLVHRHCLAMQLYMQISQCRAQSGLALNPLQYSCFTTAAFPLRTVLLISRERQTVPHHDPRHVQDDVAEFGTSSSSVDCYYHSTRLVHQLGWWIVEGLGYSTVAVREQSYVSVGTIGIGSDLIETLMSEQHLQAVQPICPR